MKDFKFETALTNGHKVGDWRPGRTPPGHDDYKSRGIFLCLYLTGKSGKRYHSQRAFGDAASDKSTIYMFGQVRDGDRENWPDDVFPDHRYKWLHEPFTCEERDDRITWSTASCPKIQVHDKGWDWVDAGGGWDLRAVPLGDKGYYFSVPAQEGFDIPHFHWGQCYWAEGTVDGDPVRGYGYLERAWASGGPEVPFVRLPLVRNMNKLWMHFYAGFEDGGYITGCARKGRLGVAWSMAYVVNDGVAKVITPTATDIAYGDDGLVKHVRLNTGEQILEFEHDAALYHPIHTVGKMISVTNRHGKEIKDRGKIVESWTVTEWWPDNAPDLLDYVADQRAKGVGRVELYEKVRIVGEYMLFPEYRMPAPHHCSEVI